MRALPMALVALALVGCPAPNPEPPDAFRPDGGPRDAFVADTNTHDAGNDGGSDAGNDGGLDANVDAYVDDTGVDAGPPDAFSCTDPVASCYRCPATTNDQFINHCTAAGVTCEHFPVTVARLPHLNADGTVPPLP